MTRTLALLVLMLLMGCGTRSPGVSTLSSTEELRTRYEKYQQLAAIQQDGTDFILTHECDSLIFTSLYRSVTGEIEIEVAEVEPGRFVRRPPQNGECYDEATGRGSDISRDMLTGLLFYVQRYERLDIAQRIWDYGSTHDWKMGRGDSRTVMTPGLVGVLARVVKNLGGPSYPERNFPQVYYPSPGYPSHLMMIQLALEGRMRGSLSSHQLEAIERVLGHSPGNPLAQALHAKYTDGDQTVATNLLLAIWPANRLPSRNDWCEEWRVQRADGDSGLFPCSDREPKTHTGGDFLFVAALILGEI